MSSYSRSSSMTTTTTTMMMMTRSATRLPSSPRLRKRAAQRRDSTDSAVSWLPKSRQFLSLRRFSSTSSESVSRAGSVETHSQKSLSFNGQTSRKKIKADPDLVLLANKFGINIATAEKYQHLLKQTLRVPVVRMSGSKMTADTPPSFPSTPIFSSKNKFKRKRGVLKMSTEPNVVRVKSEPGVVHIKTEPAVKKSAKKMNKSVVSNITKYLNTLKTEETCIKQEILSPEHSQDHNYSILSGNNSRLMESPSPVINPMAKWKNLVESSDDDAEFASPVPKEFSKVRKQLNIKSEKKNKLLLNPLSKVKKEKVKKEIKIEKNSQVSKSSKSSKMKSILIKKHGTDDPEKIRQSLINSFKVKKESPFKVKEEDYESSSKLVTVDKSNIKKEDYCADDEEVEIESAVNKNKIIKKVKAKNNKILETESEDENFQKLSDRISMNYRKVKTCNSAQKKSQTLTSSDNVNESQSLIFETNTEDENNDTKKAKKKKSDATAKRKKVQETKSQDDSVSQKSSITESSQILPSSDSFNKSRLLSFGADSEDEKNDTIKEKKKKSDDKAKNNKVQETNSRDNDVTPKLSIKMSMDSKISKSTENNSQILKPSNNFNKSQLLSFGAEIEDIKKGDTSKPKEKTNLVEQSSKKPNKSKTDVLGFDESLEFVSAAPKDSTADKKIIDKTEKTKTIVIKSNEKLPMNAIKLLKIKKKVPNPANLALLSNCLTNQSNNKNSPNNKFESLTESNGLLNGSTPMKRAAESRITCNKLSLLQARLNLSQSIESAIQGEQGDTSIEESFDSLCNDVFRMSAPEEMTLYKGIMPSSNVSLGTHEKVVLTCNSLNDKESTLSDSNLPRLSTSSQGSQEQTASQLSQSRDPRLNRSLGTTTTTTTSTSVDNPTPVSRDPRINRSLNSTTSRTPTQTMDSSTSADPRLRKRKLDEETKETAKVARMSDPEQEKRPDDSQPINSQTTTPKRTSVLERLGPKSAPSSPDHPITNELASIISSVPSGRKSICYESDNDCLSLHPDDPYDMFGEEEEESQSPPHRKFVQERISIEDELAYTPAPDKPGYNRSFNMNKRDISGMSSGRGLPSSSLSTTMPRPPTVPVINRLGRRPSDTTPAAANIQLPQSTSIQTRLGGLTNGNNSYDFYKMNAVQMMRDEANYQTQKFDSNEFVTFGENGMMNGVNPVSFNKTSMLDGVNKAVPTVTFKDQHSNFFNQYCFKLLRRGNCHMEMKCLYSHKLSVLYTLLKQKTPQLLVHIINFALANNFYFFLDSAWIMILPILQSDECFTIFEKYYERGLCNSKMINDLLNHCLKAKIHTVESFIKRISQIVKEKDNNMVTMICAAVKSKLTDGFCWEAIKDLCQKAVPPLDIVEIVVMQCLRRKKNSSHIREVFQLVNEKMSAIERSKLSGAMLESFNNLAENQIRIPSKEVLNTMPLQSNGNQSTLSQRKSKEGIENQKPVSATMRNSNKTNGLQPHHSPVEEQMSTPDQGENTNNVDYVLNSLENFEPGSAWRSQFWKLYDAVRSIKTGLTNHDYAYVWELLDNFSHQHQTDDKLLKRALYHILCDDVISCEYRVTEIIKQAVRRNSEKLTDVLFEVGLLALTDLGYYNLWVMARRLLNWVKLFEPSEPRTDFILTCAEIYLANDDPLEALYLLQSTRLVRTNRDEWRVSDSRKDHEQLRNELIFILLQALSFKDQEKAFYLFKELLNDQFIHYFPIDLPMLMDKLVLRLLLYKKYELAIEMSRLIMNKDMTFQKGTYKELISILYSVDQVAANQLLEYATNVGHYPEMQINTGFTVLVVDINYTEEELYLVINRLIEKLSENLGPTIECLTPNQIKVIFIFEDIPNGKRLMKNETKMPILEDSQRTMKNRIQLLLANRYRPAIRLSNCKVDRGCKIIGRSLVKYLQYWNANT